MKKYVKLIKLVVTLVIIGLFLWFLVLGPMLSFHDNEKTFEEAARRYYELNNDKLPTGERVRTLSLNELYKQSYIENDLFIPYTKKICSVTESWVKVRLVNNEYKYYVYLKCGLLASKIDHEGPNITLNGDSELTIGLGDEFKDPGVKSVVDGVDGKISNKEVTIKGKVDTSKVGDYELNYIAFDNLSNKTVATRKVHVVQQLKSTVKKQLGDKNYYSGANPNNYVYFSNMLFRILSIEGDNVKIVADKDIANVNYNGIEEWFKYYDENIGTESKKYMVNNMYCNMNLTDTTLDTMQCNSYTKKKKYGLLSVIDINNAYADGGNYLVPDTISWVNNGVEGDDKSAYATRTYFAGNGNSVYYSFEKEHNFGVRPVITIKGNILIASGTGSEDSPYVLEEYEKPKKNIPISERYVGEYIDYGGRLWRIQKIEKDGTTRVICEDSIKKDGRTLDVEFEGNFYGKNRVYNPTLKGNVGYKINNMTSEYLETDYFVKHEIEVPLYKKEPNYKKEYKVKKYEVKISSPNIYDMFSAASDSNHKGSYWILNSSIDEMQNNGVTAIGSVAYAEASLSYTYGIRPVAYLNKSVFVTSGKGTKNIPFKISK